MLPEKLPFEYIGLFVLVMAHMSLLPCLALPKVVKLLWGFVESLIGLSFEERAYLIKGLTLNLPTFLKSTNLIPKTTLKPLKPPQICGFRIKSMD